ncbi:hypothetical protein ABIG04_005637 [Bradyrhizobium japonicum]
MSASNAAKPATARHGEPASKIELLAGGLDHTNTKTPTDLQALRLTRRFAISIPVAIVVVGLAYGEVRS